MEDLDDQFNVDQDGAKNIARSYLNACSAEPVGKDINHRFQGLILDCTADDQKVVKRKLELVLSGNMNGHFVSSFNVHENK